MARLPGSASKGWWLGNPLTEYALVSAIKNRQQIAQVGVGLPGEHQAALK